MDSNTIINILDNQKNGIIIINKCKEVLYVNKTTRKLLGNDLNQLLGDYLNCKNTIIEKVHCQNTSKCKDCIINNTIDNVIQTKEEQVLNSIKVSKNNMKIELSMKISLYEDQYVLIELFNLDIENNQMNFLALLADKSKDIMFFKNEKLRYVYINKTYADFLNKDTDYIIGKRDIDLVNENLLDKNLYEQCLVGDYETLEKGSYYCVETLGENYFRVSKEKIDGGVLCIARDITDELKAIKKSEKDQLTGIYNRNKFQDIINKIYLNKEDEYYLALIDLDDLRNLNNKYGHLKGDKYLRTVGKILKEESGGMFFRIGGDEFAGLISGKEVSPQLVLENIFKKIDETDLNPKLSLSVGVSKFNINKDYKENYEIADRILYEVKKKGKGKFIINDV
ncbi:diguanylate cyclase [Terrisporobacter glycolicus]|uniref:Diguanylate cyclase (GGDEF) domain protein n=1 Tax=Terrisporobacter glycolicus ATCC 14880 = DSM 1288 TaxID=1121315 RepID=A0ABZ2ETH5_9FIRM|nr:diguanylate cyclase [Terrisporobacter glycolicus]